jgi:hypothetical protein
VREAGYATGTTVISSRTQPGDDMMLLPRLSVHLEDTLPLFLAQVATDFEDWRMAKPKMRGVPSRHSRAALYGASMS